MDSNGMASIFFVLFRLMTMLLAYLGGAFSPNSYQTMQCHFHWIYFWTK